MYKKESSLKNKRFIELVLIKKCKDKYFKNYLVIVIHVSSIRLIFEY